MLDKQYSILFWGKPNNCVTIDSVVECYRNIFDCFDRDYDFISDLMIKFNGKYTAKEKVNLNSVVFKGVNKEQSNLFPELGYRVEFKLLICGRPAYGSILLGATNCKVTNTFSLQIPCEISLDNAFAREDLIKLFKAVSHGYDWYWGAIADNLAIRKYKSLYENGKPATVFMINYFDQTVFDKVNSCITEDLIRKYGIKAADNIVEFDYALMYDDGIEKLNGILLDGSNDL